VKLTLTYRGKLPPTQRRVSSVKGALRAAFHPQIKAQIERRLGKPATEVETDFQGHKFISPAHEKFRTAAELDVLILTPNSSRSVGDVDNRLKTLVDGLTRPANPQQMQGFQPPPGGGSTYCLMDGDQLVKRLTVDARPWFEVGVPDNEALVVVTATIVLGDNVDMTSPMGNVFLVL